jgi:hypothetical protein
MLSVLWPLLTGSQRTQLPGYTEEAAEVNRLINQLPTSARVLLAFEYDPGLSAEMDTVAAPVLDHLMLRGAYLSVVSTSPTGPILAERFLKNIMALHNYRSGIQYVNLGFIPGGPAGLLSFVENPPRALPETLDGFAAWESPAHPALPPLQGVQDILDFSMILIIVDNPDTARMWVEQLQPKLSAAQSLTPIVMVTSAQIEPLVQPYYESDPRQVDGYVAGLRGGAAYARLTGRGGLPRLYWDAFGVGVFVAAVLLIVGGVLNIYSVALPPSTQKKSEAKG